MFAECSQKRQKTEQTLEDTVAAAFLSLTLLSEPLSSVFNFN
jgi:hypothetical protein